MGPSGDCVTYAKLWHTPMLVGLSALSIPIWRCEELLSTLYDRIQDALTDDGNHDDDESERSPKSTARCRPCVLEQVAVLYGGSYPRGWFDLSVISADET